MSMIEVNNLVKIYRINSKKKGLKEYLKQLIHPTYIPITAVNDVSFSVEEGEIVGYLGENGAGKSTTIKMLTGILTPTSGSVVVNHKIPYQDRLQNNREIGAVFGQKTSLWWDLPVIDSFKILGSMYQMSKSEYEKSLAHIVETLDLQSLLDKQVKNLSLGQKMKCEIAAVFLHHPKVVYLDEPTIGLDLLVKEKIREFILKMNQEFHTTIILTTHDVQDVEHLCQRIILVDQGKKIYDGNIESFKRKYTKQRYILLKKDGKTKEEMLENELFHIMYETEETLKIEYDPKKINPIQIMNVVGSYYHIVDVKTEEPGLEDLLKKVYRGEQDV